MRSIRQVCPIPECHVYSVLILQVFNPSDTPDKYPELLLARDCRLSLALEEILRNTILADASGYAVDLAVARIFTNYRPGTRRWDELQYPNNRWLTCETKAAMNQRFQMVHINLLDGEVRVAGQPLGSLPDEIKNSFEFRRIFRDVRISCLISPSITDYLEARILNLTVRCPRNEFHGPYYDVQTQGEFNCSTTSKSWFR